MSGSMGRSIILNFMGLCLPLIVGVLVMPGIVHRLGISEFGLLSIIWVLIGYVSVFDLGIGRALTRAVSFRMRDSASDVDELIGVGLVMMLVLGVVSAGLVAAFGGALAQFIQGGDVVHQGSRGAFIAVALAVPGVVLSNGVRGALEAHGRFGWVSFSRALTGIATYTIPFIISFYSSNLAIITLALALSRYAGLALLSIEMFRLHHFSNIISKNIFGAWDNVRDLAVFGGWMTLSNIVSPLMAYLDRIFVSNIVGVSNVGFYTAPADVVSRLSVFPDAIFGVFFPRMTSASRDRPSEARGLYILSLKLIQPAMLGFSAVTTMIGYDFLNLWLGKSFAENSYIVLCLLTIVMYVNSCTRPAYNIIQAAGRSDITAKIHLCEFAIYLPAIIFFTRAFGIAGAAWASLFRVVFDYGLMTIFAQKFMNESNRSREYIYVIGIGAVQLGIIFMNTGIFKYILLLTMIFGAATFVWFEFLRGRSIRSLATFL